MILRFYDDHEGRWDEWLRPKLVGSIDLDGKGSIVRYHLKLRPFWLPPLFFTCAGIASVVVGLYSLGLASCLSRTCVRRTRPSFFFFHLPLALPRVRHN